MNISINYYGFLQIIIAVIIIQTSEGQSGGFGFSSGFGESSSSGNGFGNMFGSSSGSDGGDDEDSCPPIPHDCDPKCIKYDEPHCRKCQCPSDGASNSPFNQGTSLYQTPYSSAISSMQVMTGTPYGGMGHIANGISPMSWPGIFLHPGTSINGVQCIKGDIVCPQYCLVEDEYGCKSCPCGPANGMTPPITSGHITHLHLQSPDEHKEPETKDCLATIICIISCNEGYKLGPKDKDGCQSCSCTKQKHKDDESNSKKNNSSATGGSGNGNSGNESGTGSNSKTNSSPSPSGAGMPSPFSVGGGGDSGSGGDGSGFNPMFPGAGMGMSGSGSGMGMSGGGGGMGMGIGGGGGGGGCVGPFCTMAGSSGGGGAGGGISAMMGGGAGKSPFGVMGSGDPRMPMSGSGSTSPMATGNKDCIGPACSAKNGKKLVEEITSTHAKACPTTDMCVKTCKYNVKLGAIGSDGCPSCACEMTPATQAPQQQLCDEVVRCMLSCKTGYEIGASNEHGCASCYCKTPPTSAPVLQHSIAPAVSTRASCDETTLRCIHTCKYGYHLQSSSATECPVCRCLPPPTAAPTQKPNVYSILKSCPEAVHCMTTCNNGYTMETKPGDSCPRCKCNAVAVVQLHCAAALSCPLGCKVGYRCGDDGCPTCECIIPANVGVSHSTAYLQASVSCNPHFSCVSQCLHGYQSGDNGCPTCKCLQLITAAAVNPVHGSQHHETVSIASSQHTQHVHQTWGFKDVLKNCPNVVTCVTTCSNGIDIGGAPAGQCPKCSCKGVEPTRVPQSSHAGTLVGHIVQGSSNSHPGVHILPSPHPSVGSGHSGTGSLPHTAVNSGEHVHPSFGAIHTSVVSGSAQHSSHSSVGMPSRPAGQPGIGGGSGGKITIGPMLTHGGTSSAVSEHHEDCIGPACSAKNGMHTDTKKLEKSKSQSPGQCVDIIRCVFSCHHGYKIGDKQKDGCPTCQCLD